MQEQMTRLLDDVKRMVIKNEAEVLKQGKAFNVFYIQGIADEEVKVCRFIRELLDPKGSHGQGSVFLRFFMRDVLKDAGFTEDEYAHATVTREERIDESRRVDIVVRIRDRLFPIEVKIYAKDQDKQCFDYYQYAAAIDPNAKLYYLSLFKNDRPSKDSILTLVEKKQYERVSFSEEVLKWLNDCIYAPEIEQIYPVRETLIQFRTVIKDLTGKQKGNLKMEIKEKINSSYENAIAAVEIANTLPAVKTEKMMEVLEGIRNHMVTLGYEVSDDSFKDGVNKYYYSPKKRVCPGLYYDISVEDASLNGKLKLTIEIYDRLYFGISPYPSKKKTPVAEKYVEEKLKPKNIKNLDLDVSDGFYWWSHFHKENDVDYHTGNEYFWKLFDKEYYEQYMKDIYTILTDYIKCMKK